MIRLTPNGAASATSCPLTYEIVEKLCRKYCAGGSMKPIANVTFGIAKTSLVGTQMFATVQAVAQVTYKPKGGCGCCMMTNTFVEEFVVSFAGASSASTVSVSSTAGSVSEAYVCQTNCNVAQGVNVNGTVTVNFVAG